ncbi:MAG TPA: class I SAM-dependent methyltransferase [Candidatus Didemnitutus sp.]|nr:class I SAM-dependent methyltransferase [Candidatus Didemnitutus sp.]
MKPLYDFSSLAVDRTLSPGDTMVASAQPEQYFDLGRRALELIRFSAELCDKPHYPDILDLACGHGRVMRWIRAAYDYASITACDVDRSGVVFCAQQFRATPVVASADPASLPFKAQFDLIWVGSLVTHLPQDRWLSTLEHLIKWTRECGVIVFTTQGRTVASLLAEGRKDVAENVDKAALLADFARDGFAYQRYFENDAANDYGLALSSPEWVMRQLQRHPEVIIRSYLEECWGMQDVVILYKKAGHYRPVLPEPATARAGGFWSKRGR